MNPNNYQIIATKIRNLLSTKDFLLVAIDGRCASGKTTLAEQLQTEFYCNVIHMDDFYLPLSQRDSNWRTTPAKNIDFLKLKELFSSFSKKDTFQICPYSCNTASYTKPVTYQKTALTIIEGSYSCHPILKEFYELSIFLTVSSEEQKKRLVKRNGEDGYLRFRNVWIPLEEAYFNKYNIETQCDITVTN